MVQEFIHREMDGLKLITVNAVTYPSKFWSYEALKSKDLRSPVEETAAYFKTLKLLLQSKILSTNSVKLTDQPILLNFFLT